MGHRLLVSGLGALLLVAVVAPPAPAATVDVALQDGTAVPSSVTVDAGDTVRWTNRDTVGHAVTATDGSFDSSPNCGPGACIEPGETFSLVVTKPATVTYVVRTRTARPAAGTPATSTTGRGQIVVNEPTTTSTTTTSTSTTTTSTTTTTIPTTTTTTVARTTTTTASSATSTTRPPPTTSTTTGASTSTSLEGVVLGASPEFPDGDGPPLELLAATVALFVASLAWSLFAGERRRRRAE
jgi:plastocyanin